MRAIGSLYEAPSRDFHGRHPGPRWTGRKLEEMPIEPGACGPEMVSHGSFVPVNVSIAARIRMLCAATAVRYAGITPPTICLSAATPGQLSRSWVPSVNQRQAAVSPVADAGSQRLPEKGRNTQAESDCSERWTFLTDASSPMGGCPLHGCQHTGRPVCSDRRNRPKAPRRSSSRDCRDREQREENVTAEK